MWITILASLVVMAVLITIMAVSVLIGRRPLEPECKALERLSAATGIPLCEACDADEDCPLKKLGLVRSAGPGQVVAA